ncbi:MAG: YebC/PmpR family DNA-binding transcriptional regulator [Flavobacteriales bacterium]|nr:YebC/PmpR family DNA-binding transcriptional regulator [Flavobacteriales bacterium]|tara:strand:- start:6822 stop:7580 length:759 start_codon:yes stop_codon:yes gene_type:complete
MAGHSKWANIKHRKGAQDAKRGKVFTRIIKEISVAVKEGGEDPDSNPRLRMAIQNAKGVNMPKDNVQRAINKASGSNANSYLEVTYEGYAPNGIAIFVECTTDNINRTVADVRAIFNKNGGELGKNGSLEFLFDRKGVFIIEKASILKNIEEFEMNLIDFGLEEFETLDEVCTIVCDYAKFGSMQEKLCSFNLNISSAELNRIPKSTKELDRDSALQVLQLVNKLEDHEDVQQVFHDLKITSQIMDSINEKY